MKKVLSLIVIMILCFSLTACNNKEDDNQTIDVDSLINNTLVFTNNMSTMKFYYMDTFLEKIELIYEVENEDIANIYINMYSEESNTKYYSSATYNGTEVVVEYSEESLNNYKYFDQTTLITYMNNIGYKLEK